MDARRVPARGRRAGASARGRCGAAGPSRPWSPRTTRRPSSSAGSTTSSRSTTHPTSSRSSSPPTPRAATRRDGGARAARATHRLSARWQGRGGTGPSARRRATSSPSRTRTPPGRRTLRHLVAALADPEVAYVCGQLRLESADGSNREGAYWRYEMWLREQESRLGSITGGNGSIYALRRGDYVEVDPRWGHDLSFPYRMVQNGRRAVQPAAHAFEKPTPSNEAEYRRKVRMFEHWEITLRGSMLRRLPAGYLVEVVSHRLLRYSSGVLHLPARGRASFSSRPAPFTCSCSRRSSRSWLRRWRSRSPVTTRSWATARGPRQLPPPWRPRHLGGRGGDALGSREQGCGRRDRRSRPRRDEPSAAAALAVKLEDRGPVSSVSGWGRTGAISELKLRTMVVGAERKGASTRSTGRFAHHPRPGCGVDRRAAAALERAPRRDVHRRAATDAALPGRATDHQRRRLDVRPGLTGWAQVNGRAELAWEDRIELDVWYVEHRTPGLDLRILLRTPLVRGHVQGRGAGPRRDAHAYRRYAPARDRRPVHLPASGST